MTVPTSYPTAGDVLDCQNSHPQAVSHSIIIRHSDPMVCRILHLLVVRAYSSATVVAVTTNQEALASYAQHPADLIITNSGSLGLDGITFIRLLRARGVEAPILTVSGNPFTSLEAFAAGTTAFLAAPFAPDQLQAILGELLPGQAQYDELLGGCCQHK